jgi:hypothetical protein
MVPFEVRLRAQAVRKASRHLVKESRHRDRSGALIREAEAGLFETQRALGEAMSQVKAPKPLRLRGEELVDFMLRTLRSGPMRYRMEAAHWLTERGFGKPPQAVEHIGEDEPIHVTLTWPEGA